MEIRRLLLIRSTPDVGQDLMVAEQAAAILQQIFEQPVFEVTQSHRLVAYEDWVLAEIDRPVTITVDQLLTLLIRTHATIAIGCVGVRM